MEFVNFDDSWNRPDLDMALMAACNHHIIANSTFSWWGAWLSDQVGKVFAPRIWFPDRATTATELYPKAWRVLDNAGKNLAGS